MVKLKSIIALSLVTVFINCHQSNSKITTVNKNTPSKISNYKTTCTFLTVDDVDKNTLGNNTKDTLNEKLEVEKITNSYKTTYIYKYGYRNKRDTLIISQDSIEFNHKKLKVLATKTFESKRVKIKVFKFHYNFIQGPAVTFYCSDSLGLILGQEIYQRSGIVKYGQDFQHLQNQIINDSVFFKFNPQY